MSSERVLGVDGCKGGWFGMVLEADGTASGVFARTIQEVVEAAGRISVAAIDIPIGLPTHKARAADVEASRLLKGLSSSVFQTPIRAALLAPDHTTASAMNKAVTGKGVSQQAFSLRHRIFEVESWLPGAGCDVREVHPEVSFATLIGKPARHSKKTWAGLAERLAALESAGISLDNLGIAAAKAGIDDVVDAAAAAWTAHRVAERSARSVPSPPERVAGWERPVAIWA